MNSQLIRCTTCGKELIVDEEISSLVCGYCFEAVDLNEARAVSRRKEPPEFLVKNGVLERYFGERSYDIRTPPGVKKIGPVAFSEGVCGVTVSEGVEVIETRAFEACWYLEYLELPNSLKKIEKSDEYSRQTLPLGKMIEGPVKPTIVCSPSVRKLVLESIPEEERASAERGISWR